MSDPRTYEALLALGLSVDAARAYLLLADLGRTDLATLRSGLRISRNRTQAALRELEARRLVAFEAGGRPAWVHAPRPDAEEQLRLAAPPAFDREAPRPQR